MNTKIQTRQPHAPRRWVVITGAWLCACGATEAADTRGEAAAPDSATTGAESDAILDAGPDAPLGAAPDATLRQTLTEEKTLLVGEVVEAILSGGPGDRAVIALSGPAAGLDWNLHGHSTEESFVLLEEFGITQTSYSFAPTAEHDWWLLLRNARKMPTTVTLTLELYGEMQWRGWQ